MDIRARVSRTANAGLISSNISPALLVALFKWFSKDYLLIKGCRDPYEVPENTTDLEIYTTTVTDYESFRIYVFVNFEMNTDSRYQAVELEPIPYEEYQRVRNWLLENDQEVKSEQLKWMMEYL